MEYKYLILIMDYRKQLPNTIRRWVIAITPPPRNSLEKRTFHSPKFAANKDAFIFTIQMKIPYWTLYNDIMVSGRLNTVEIPPYYDYRRNTE